MVRIHWLVALLVAILCGAPVTTAVKAAQVVGELTDVSAGGAARSFQDVGNIAVRNGNFQVSWQFDRPLADSESVQLLWAVAVAEDLYLDGAYFFTANYYDYWEMLPVLGDGRMQVDFPRTPWADTPVSYEEAGFADILDPGHELRRRMSVQVLGIGLLADLEAPSLAYRVTWSLVPEPVVWMLLIAGFAMIGVAARRRRPTGRLQRART